MFWAIKLKNILLDLQQWIGVVFFWRALFSSNSRPYFIHFLSQLFLFIWNEYSFFRFEFWYAWKTFYIKKNCNFLDNQIGENIRKSDIIILLDKITIRIYLFLLEDETSGLLFLFFSCLVCLCFYSYKYLPSWDIILKFWQWSRTTFNRCCINGYGCKIQSLFHFQRSFVRYGFKSYISLLLSSFDVISVTT